MPFKKYKTEAERIEAHRAASRASYQKHYWKRRAARKARDQEFQAKKFNYKAGLECWNPECNFNGADNPKKLEFHHMNPANKRFSPFKATTWAAFMKEVRKCVPLCKDCHVSIEKWKHENGRANTHLEPTPF